MRVYACHIMPSNASVWLPKLKLMHKCALFIVLFLCSSSRWVNGKHGVRIINTAHRYCDYFDKGYFGYTFDKTAGSSDQFPCPVSAGKYSREYLGAMGVLKRSFRLQWRLCCTSIVVRNWSGARHNVTLFRW